MDVVAANGAAFCTRRAQRIVCWHQRLQEKKAQSWQFRDCPGATQFVRFARDETQSFVIEHLSITLRYTYVRTLTHSSPCVFVVEVCVLVCVPVGVEVAEVALDVVGVVVWLLVAVVVPCAQNR